MSVMHPLPAFIFFAAAILITAIFQNPVISLISICGALATALKIKGASVFVTMLRFLPFCAVAALINLLFVNRGESVLFYLPGGNAATWQSLFCSVGLSVMLIAVMLWFVSFNRVMTSDKIMYLFARTAPSLGLLISMTLRALPRLLQRTRETAAAQSLIGRDPRAGGKHSRAKNAVKVLKISVASSAEGAAITARSMKNRGYGTAKRTFCRSYRFAKRDIAALALFFAAIASVIAAAVCGGAYCRFYPSFTVGLDGASVTVYIAFAVFCAYGTAAIYD